MPYDVDAETTDDALRQWLGGLRRHFLLGLAALVPLLLVWFVVERVVLTLPTLAGLDTSSLGTQPWLAGTGIAFATLGLVFVLGWLAQTVIGRRLAGLPVLRFVYGAQRELLETLQDASDRGKVVLVQYQSRDLKSVAIEMRRFRDEASGEELAAVYLLGSPNPLGGHLKIVTVDRVTRTRWTPQEALRFVVSGGAVAPAKVSYRESV